MTAVTEGVVTFKDGATILGTDTLDANGQATFTTTALTVGSHAITAVYTATSLHGGSVSAPITHTVNTTTGLGPSTSVTALSSSGNPIAVGSSVTITATVTSAGNPVTTGSVTFSDGGTTLVANAALNSVGKATYITSSLSVGSHTITAAYSGSVDFNTSSGQISQVVSAAGTGGTATSTTVVSSQNPSVNGAVVTYSATVIAGQTLVTVGSVTFTEGATVLASNVAVNNFGFAQFATTTLSTGIHTIVATYNGIGSFNSSTGQVTQTVNATLPPAPGTWQEAYDSNDMSLVMSWYSANTGHLAEGFNPANLWYDGADINANQKVRITAAWLTAHQGPNVVQSGGRWTITGLHCKFLEPAQSNLTFRHCFIDRQGQVPGHGVMVVDPTITGGSIEDLVPWTDIRLEYCTMFGGNTSGIPSSGDFGDSIYYNPAVSAQAPDGLVISNCDTQGYRAGFKIITSTTIEYCWSHNLYIIDANDHNTASSIRGRYSVIRRTLISDGNSSCMSFYPDTSPYTEFFATENFLTTPNAIYEAIMGPRNPGDPMTLQAGYKREFVGNKFERGGFGPHYPPGVGEGGFSGGGQWMTKSHGNSVFTNTYAPAGTPVMMDDGAVPVVGQPMLHKYMYNELGGGNVASLTSYNFTPSPNSTLFILANVGQAGHSVAQNISITTTGGGGPITQTYNKILESLTEVGAGNQPNYGQRLTLFQTETGATTEFQSITMNPFTATGDTAYFGFWVFEVTGKKGLTLVQSSITMNHAVPFGGTIDTLTTNPLPNPATNGNLVMGFTGCLAGSTTAGQTSPLAAVNGWFQNGHMFVLGSHSGAPQPTGCLYWRKNFTGTGFTIGDLGNGVGNAGVLLTEFSGA